MIMFKIILGLFFTYFFSSIIILLFICRFLKIKKDQILELFFYILGIGPIIISWILSWLLRFFPRYSDIFYLSVVIILFIFFLGLSYKQIFVLKNIFFELKSFLEKLKWRKIELLLSISLLIIIILNFTNAIILPLSENDALQYAFVSKLIYIRKTIDFYPIINTDPQTGFYAISSHPLGYICLEFWSYLIQGTSDYPGLIKLISPFYLLYTALTAWFLLSTKKGNIYGLMWALLLCSTPNYFIQGSICGIDSFRIYTFFLSFIWLYKLIKEENLKITILLGMISGLSMYSHSIGGVFTLPFIYMGYMCFSKQKINKKIINLCIITAVAIIIGGYRYINNFFLFGTPIYDSLPIYKLQHLHYKEYVRYTRNILTFLERIINGALAGFTKKDMFGITYWLFLISIFGWKWVLTERIKSVSKIFILIIVLYYICLGISLILDMDVFIGNYRYFLTIQPFITYFGSLLIGKIYEKLA